MTASLSEKHKMSGVVNPVHDLMYTWPQNYQEINAVKYVLLHNVDERRAIETSLM